MFRTKREGVHFVLDAVAPAFPVARCPGLRRRRPVPRPRPRRATSRWRSPPPTGRPRPVPWRRAIPTPCSSTPARPPPTSSRSSAARSRPTGRTDPDRLASGELVYTGALRTPAEAMASHVWVHGRTYGMSAEGFALAGDVHVWRGELAPARLHRAHAGRPRRRRAVRGRAPAARALRRSRVDGRRLASRRLPTRWPARRWRASPRPSSACAGRARGITTAVVTGLGAFLGAAAARAPGPATSSPLPTSSGPTPPTTPRRPRSRSCCRRRARSPTTPARRRVPPAPRSWTSVVKVGGSLLRAPRRTWPR